MTADPRTAQLILALRQGGVRDQRVLEAVEWVPRALFVEEAFADQAYADLPLPIDCGQTISQPFTVAMMTDRLDLSDRHTVLEIGTGSGYQTAILSRLCRRIVTIERYRTLARQAGERLKALKISNVTQIVGDGSKGWPQLAPFERIIVTAAARHLPQALVDQLAIGGIMVIPIEDRPGNQDLFRIRKTAEGLVHEHLMPTRFVPLVEGIARDG